MIELAQPPAKLTECVEQARELIRETAEVLGVAEIRPMPVDPDLHAADAVSYTHLTLPTNREV